MEVLVIRVVGGKTYAFGTEKALITLGRDEQSDIVFNDKNVSRKHAEIRREPDGYSIADLGSRNGTFVNVCRIAKRLLLQRGDIIRLGSSELVFHGVEKGAEHPDEETEEKQEKAAVGVVSCIKIPRGAGSTTLDFMDFSKARLSSEKAYSNLKVLFEMTKLFKGVFESSEILERSMNKVAETMNADEVCLFLYDEGSGEYKLAISRASGGGQESCGARVSRTILERATKNVEAVLSHDARLDERFGGTESIIQKHIVSSMCVPLITNERVIGAIYLHNTQAAHAFSEEDLYFLSILARHISDVLENLQLYEQVRQKERLDTELRVAHDIQQQLLPREFPADARVEFFGLNMPAREVGGDFYDVITIEKGKYLLVIGDVSGKGVPAALFMAAIRSIIRSQSIGECNLEEMVKRANTLVEADAQDGTFITAFCAIIDAGTMELRFINAGHNPPILCRQSSQAPEPASEQTRFLESSGKPLGILPDARYCVLTVQLNSGDLLLCYTDGITEATGAKKEMFGVERLVEAAERYKSLRAQEIVRRIIDEVQSFAQGREQFDDLTVLAMKIRA
jgi:sigma-B regulation protein RsbU (phosphoserine phosphatase)